ncbi:Transcriptional regulator, AcrR family [hydrothermal vent metagenome]|uniref:Transcriptional regulator, AcrR family n=1 Tax=hydrothermal vent metagenome TaxID=652676 RepID=A0A3B0WT24_9ZZZZ
MARPREFDPNDVLQTAIELFWEKGYYDSSVDEVVRQSGVAKYGIYGTFGSKRELFKEALKQYASDRHRDIQSPIRKLDASLPEIQQFFKRAVKIITQEGSRRGCMMVNTGVELGFRDAEIRDFVTNFFHETEEVMERCLTNAVELGQIEALSNISKLATYLVTEFRTALMLASSGCSRREIQAHLDIALRVLH